MSTHKNIDKICGIVVVFALLLTVAFIHAESFGVQAASRELGYESRLFDTSTVHTIDIVMEDWEEFLATCTDEEYVLCSVVIDGETYENVAIRAKGNTSLTQVAAYGNNRYSFKIEFDHYDNAISYYGLDKLNLNNIIQDNTYMKDYLTYQMMGYFGVAAPLCSYTYITVNGEDWGLYLAVEGVEESFLMRNFGRDYGELYKPDSQSMGGGRGNGGGFQMEEWQEGDGTEAKEGRWYDQATAPQTDISRPEAGENPVAEPPADWEAPPMQAEGESRQPPMDMAGTAGRGAMTDNSDVSLIYTDDEYSSYANIFDNAKTKINDADKDRLIDSLQQLNAEENIAEVVDVESVIRYFVVHNFVCNFDSYTGLMIHNYYLYEQDGQLSMIPWDYNLAFGGFPGAQDATALVNYPIDTPVSGGTVDSRPMLAWIFADDAYTALYHQYFAEFIATYFESGYFTAMIDSVQELISPYVEQDPTKFCSMEEFEAGIATLKEFCLLRAESISGQLEETIPATAEGQEQEPETLIDATAIDILAMGSMNTGGMPGGMGGLGERPEEADGWQPPQGEMPAEQLPEDSLPQNEMAGADPAEKQPRSSAGDSTGKADEEN